MAEIYNFLDYKNPKRKYKKYLIIGWLLAFLSIFMFMIPILSIVSGITALSIGLILNYKNPKSGTALIISSILLTIIALIANYFLNNLIRVILGVFFLVG